MLQKLVDFFKNLFSGLFGGSSKKSKPNSTANTPPPDPTPDPTPDLEIDSPQDGSEILPDSLVVVVNETESVVIENDNAPTTEPTSPNTPGNDTRGVTPEPPTTNPEPPAADPIEPPATPTEVEPAHQARYLWCLDNGHGELTKGKRSPRLPNGDQLLEYRFNRDIVKRIIKALDEVGVKTFNVVPEVDTDNFLKGRVDRANQKQSDLPKLFVSIHANAAPAPSGKWASPTISGIETWYFHKSSRGRKVAAVFQKHLIEKTGWKNRHIKSRPEKQFYVLRKTNMTAVLTENGFYNNQAECQLLLRDDIRQKIADAHVDAILEIEKNGI